MKDKTVQRLLELKENIQQARIEHAQATGALKQSLQRLKDEFDVSTLEKAQSKLKKLQDEQKEIEEEIEEAIEKLEEKYEW